MADTLVRRGIPAVVAMQFEFSDDAAIEFAPALYGALAAGLSSPVEVVTLNVGERAAFICHVTHPVSVKESLGAAFSISKRRELFTPAKDDYITLDREYPKRA